MMDEIKFTYPDPIDGEIMAKIMTERSQGKEYWRFQEMTREQVEEIYGEAKDDQ